MIKKKDPFKHNYVSQREEYQLFRRELLKRLEKEKHVVDFKLPDNYKPVPDDNLEDWRKKPSF